MGFYRSSDELTPSTNTQKAFPTVSHEQRPRPPSFITSNREPLSAAERARRNLNAKLANPLAGLSHAALRSRGERYARKHHIGDEADIRAFALGAVLAQDPVQYEKVEGLTHEELEVLRHEFTHKWSQPKLLYLVIVMCSVSAAVQGMGKFALTKSEICRSNR